MDKDRKKQLQEEYKQMRSDMGVFLFECIPTGTVYLGCDQNIKGTLNSIQFQLRNNSYFTNRALQAEWTEYGEKQFRVAVLEILDYDEKNPDKQDYSDDLKILKDFWKEKYENAKDLRKDKK